MDEDTVKLQHALTAISAENQAFRLTEVKLHREIAELRKSLSEINTDVGATARLLADRAAGTLRASADALAAGESGRYSRRCEQGRDRRKTSKAG